MRLFFEVSIVDEIGRVHGRVKREIDRDAAYIGNRAVDELRAGVMWSGMDTAVQMMRVREFRKEMLEHAAAMAGVQLAEFLEDREGWHGLDRADSAESRLK